MNLAITIIIATVMIFGGIYLVVEMSSKVYDIDKDIKNGTFSNYITTIGTDRFYIITGKFNVPKQCEIKVNDTIDIYVIKTQLKPTFNEKVLSTLPGIKYTFDINCCDLQNNCNVEKFTFQN